MAKSIILRTSNGFTLVEMLISIGVMSIVFLVASDQVNNVISLTKKIEREAYAREESSLISQYITREIRSAGGGLLRPFMSIWLEDSCSARDNLPDCAKSDRITVNRMAADTENCSITNTSNPARLHFNISQAICCSNKTYRRNVAVLKDDFFAFYYITNFQQNTATGDCFVDVQPGQSYGLNSLNPPLNFSDWTSGAMLTVDTKTVFVDPKTGELKQYIDSNNNRSMDEGEVVILTDQFTDLQIALGYDADPQDGITFDSNDDKDEWLYNFAGSTERLGLGGLTTATFRDLLTCRIGLVIETTKTNAFGEAQVLNGPTHTDANKRYEKALSNIYFRSSLIFNE